MHRAHTLTPPLSIRLRVPGRLGLPVALIMLACGLIGIASQLPFGAQSSPAALPAIRSMPASGEHFGAAVPLAAQGPISTALGRDQGSYRITGVRATNPRQHLAIAFAPAGATITAGSARLGLRLTAFGRAGDQRPVPITEPRISANRAVYAHPGVSEWYGNGPLGLEQGFDLPTRPTSGSGPLALRVQLTGTLHPRLTTAGELTLTGAGHQLRYTGLIATDARGQRLPAQLTLNRTQLTITVNDTGAAYPVRIDPFVQQGELSPDDETSSFGAAIASSQSGGTIVVGSPSYGGGGFGPAFDAAYVFERGERGWSDAEQVATLSEASIFDEDSFGASVGISESGDTIVVGAPAYGESTSAPGAAYVFVEPSAGWSKATGTPDAELEGTATANGDAFGSAVAVSDDTVVVGGPYHKDGSNVLQGLGYVFEKPMGGWGSGTQPQAQDAKLEASDGNASDDLGCSIAISGQTVVAGAPGDSWCDAGDAPTPTTAGAAYVFTEPGGGWSGTLSETRKLTASDGAVGDALGASVTIAGSTIGAGAPMHGPGAVYVYQKSGTSWTSSHQTAELTAAGGATGDELGAALAISPSAETILAGTPDKDRYSGTAYVFAPGSTGWPSATQSELRAADALPDAGAGSAVGIAGDTMLVGASNFDGGYGTVYAFVARPTITIGSPANGASFTQGQSVRTSYTCSAPAGATVTACAGPVASGAVLNTSTLGTHGFTVSTTDSDGGSIAQTVTYKVVAPPPHQPPKITKAKLSHTKFAVSSKPTAVSARKSTGKGKAPQGTSVQFALSEAAGVTLTIAHTTAGQRSGASCKPSKAKHIAKAKRCTATVSDGTIKRRSERAGADTIAFSGRIGRKPLAAGAYSLQIGAADSLHAAATPVTLKFTIVK